MIDDYFLLYCNISSYFPILYGFIYERIQGYINLDDNYLKLLNFKEGDLPKRKEMIAKMKNEEAKNSFYSKLCKFAKWIFPSNEKEEENSGKVKII